jgi:hypothetical protein
MIRTRPQDWTGLFLLVLLSLAACVPAAGTPVATPTLAPNATPIPTLVSTPAVALPETPTVTPTEASTAVGTAMSAFAPTLNPALVTIEPPADPNSPLKFVTTLVSPDATWIAEYLLEEATQGTPHPTLDPTVQAGNPAIYHQTFHVYRQDRAKTWTVEDTFFYGEGYSYPHLLDWSKDSRHLYFRHDIAGTCSTLPGRGDLNRLDVTTGNVEPLDLPLGSQHRISPDERWMAYVGPEKSLDLEIQDLQTGTLRTVAMPEPGPQDEHWAAGVIAWSPDSQSLAITIVHGDLCSGNPIGVWVARLDLAQMHWTLLIENSPKLIWEKRWPVADKIWLNGWQGSYWIDALTGQIATAPEETRPSITSSPSPDTSTQTPAPQGTLPPTIYPSPLPFLQPVNGIETSGCPDLTRVQKANSLPAQTALDVLTALTSGEATLFRQSSDQTFWGGNPGVLPVLSDLTIHPAAQAPYAPGIKVGCGQKTLDLSWWIQDGSGARGVHYFLINRKDHWLVWSSYP